MKRTLRILVVLWPLSFAGVAADQKSPGTTPAPAETPAPSGAAPSTTSDAAESRTRQTSNAPKSSAAAKPEANTPVKPKSSGNPRVRLTTGLGVIEIELQAQRAPVSTANFLRYVDKGAYNGTIFHRVMPNFMIQGGGFEPGMKPRPSDAPIPNEADNGLKNLVGTVAMARTSDPHSATAQFFINTAKNAKLDHRSKTQNGWGYAVFGKVTKGMDVVRKIESIPTQSRGPYDDVPTRAPVIAKIERLRE